MNASRNSSLSSSISSRAPYVASSRTTSFSSSVGPGARPATAYGARPQSSMAFSHSTSTRPTSLQRPRPATSMANRWGDDNNDNSRNGKGKGMIPQPLNPSSFQSKQGYSTIQIRKSRNSRSMHSLGSLRSIGNIRDVSVSTAMSMLRIDDGLNSDNCKEYQAMEEPVQRLLTAVPSSTRLNNTSQRNIGVDSSENALVLFKAAGDSLVAPKTPSQIPVLSKMEAVVATPATPCKIPKASPVKTPFLSKSSNITAFTAFDIEGRLGNMEEMYTDLKEKFSGTNAERNGLEEAVALYKARGKFLLPLLLVPD